MIFEGEASDPFAEAYLDCYNMYLQESLQFGQKPDKITFFIHPTWLQNAIHQSQVRLCHQCHQIPFPFGVLLSLRLSTFDARKQLLKLRRKNQTSLWNPSRRKLTKEFKQKRKSKKLHISWIIFWSSSSDQIILESTDHLSIFCPLSNSSRSQPSIPCSRRIAREEEHLGCLQVVAMYIALWLKSGKQKEWLFLNYPFSGLNHFEPHINRQATSNRIFW